MKLLFVVFIILIFGCGESTDSTISDKPEMPVSQISEITENPVQNLATDISSNREYWICHHPGTEFHNQSCVEEEFPAGCFVKGDLHKFCWLMFEEDCVSPISESIGEACLNVGLIQN